MSWTEAKIKRYIKEGRGKGEGSQYKPWLTADDMPKSYKEYMLTTPYNWKHHRTCELLSELDAAYFYEMHWDESVLDIRENFPLDRDRTVQIAKELGVRHSVDFKSKIPLVMTTSFLLTIEQGGQTNLAARAVMKSSELDSGSVANKLRIQRHYWDELNIPFSVVTEHDISWVLAKNIQFLHHYKTAPHYEINEETCRYVVHELRKNTQYVTPTATLFTFAREIAPLVNEHPGTILTHIWFLIANRIVELDMHNYELSPSTELRHISARDIDFKVTQVSNESFFADNVLVV